MVNGEYLSVVEGAAQQCINGFVAPVCDIGWDDRDATAFCRRFQGDSYSKFLPVVSLREPMGYKVYFEVRLRVCMR